MQRNCDFIGGGYYINKLNIAQKKKSQLGWLKTADSKVHQDNLGFRENGSVFVPLDQVQPS